MTTRRNLRTTRQAATLVTLTAMLLALAPAATAVPYLESAYGGQSPWLSAEINGLGGTPHLELYICSNSGLSGQ